MPLARRFHRRKGMRLKRWEAELFLRLHSTTPEIRLWSNVLADALYIIYRTRERRAALDALAWIANDEPGHALDFRDVALGLGLDPDDIRRDVLKDNPYGTDQTAIG